MIFKNYFSLLLVIIIFINLINALFNPVFRISDNSLIEVKDENNEFLPLCADSFTESLAMKICRKHKYNHVNSFQMVPLSNILSLNVHCNKRNNCTQNLTFGCDNGVQIQCFNVSHAKKCPENMYLFRQNKCLLISNITVNNYENAKEFCINKNLSLISFSSTNITTQINGIIKILNRQKTIPSPETKLLTSAVRRSSKWIFDNQIIYNETIYSGNGRCLGLHVDQLIAVDCNNDTFWPICELNLASDCIPSNGQYDGTMSITKNGLQCLQWNNPIIGQQINLFPEQKLWEHNYCRNIGSNRQKPWCLVSINTFQECNISYCNDDNTTFSGCAEDEYRCGISDQCVYKEYFCDYEQDCQNNFDEFNCPNYLYEFKLIGDYKLIDDVYEIWTHIPHIQGCAQKCIKATEFRCESFSYDENQRICLLSFVSFNPAIILENVEYKYYKRMLANGSLSYEIDMMTMKILVKKNNLSLPLCADKLNDTTIDILCEQFGYGQSLKSIPVISDIYIEDYVWTIDCLRNSSCLIPEKIISEENEFYNTCNSVLRCSDCHPNEQFPCRTTGFCISTDKVCDQIRDCADGSDEDDCLNPKWRLITSDNPNIGRVQIYQQSKWNDVCVDDLDEQKTNFLCKILEKGDQSIILPLFNQYTTSTTFKIDCINNTCLPVGIGYCNQGILNIKCKNKDQNTCGTRKVKYTSLDDKRRFRRIVNGFDTILGAYPWTATVKYKIDSKHHCGASIISENYLITAAHCFQNNRNITNYIIVVGDWDNAVDEETEQIFEINDIIFYPFYDDIFQHDIVIIKINGLMTFNDYVQPICLPPTGYKYFNGQKCIVTGWGNNGTIGIESVSKMQAAILPILDRDLCLGISILYSAMSKTAFCAGYLNGDSDSCQGDSGGPFACEYQGHYYLVGVISWGDGCGLQPGIYTSVTSYLGWIRNVTNNDF